MPETDENVPKRPGMSRRQMLKVTAGALAGTLLGLSSRGSTPVNSGNKPSTEVITDEEKIRRLEEDTRMMLEYTGSVDFDKRMELAANFITPERIEHSLKQNGFLGLEIYDHKINEFLLKIEPKIVDNAEEEETRVSTQRNSPQNSYAVTIPQTDQNPYWREKIEKLNAEETTPGVYELPAERLAKIFSELKSHNKTNECLGVLYRESVSISITTLTESVDPDRVVGLQETLNELKKSNLEPSHPPGSGSMMEDIPHRVIHKSSQTGGGNDFPGGRTNVTRVDVVTHFGLHATRGVDNFMFVTLETPGLSGSLVSLMARFNRVSADQNFADFFHVNGRKHQINGKETPYSELAFLVTRLGLSAEPYANTYTPPLPTT